MCLGASVGGLRSLPASGPLPTVPGFDPRQAASDYRSLTRPRNLHVRPDEVRRNLGYDGVSVASEPESAGRRFDLARVKDLHALIAQTSQISGSDIIHLARAGLS